MMNPTNRLLIFSLLCFSQTHAKSEKNMTSFVFAEACSKKIIKEMESCFKISKISDFIVDKKSYALALAECKAEESEIQQFVLVENKADQSCNVLNSDSSFIEYMHGVDDDIKAQTSVKVFESAIKAELAYQLPSKEDKSRFASELREKNKMGALTKDEQWVLKHLEAELKK